MAANLKKFVNPKFIKTIDLSLMRRLIARHEGRAGPIASDLFDQEEGAARKALSDLLAGSEESYPEGLRADLHRIAELGNSRGLELIETQAERRGINLLPEIHIGDAAAPNPAHDPKQLALHVFLDHPALFDAAADHMAMLTANRLHEVAGHERGVAADLTAAKVQRFRAGICALFRDAFLGDYCRLGDYDDGDEINLVVSHGSLVSTLPVVEGQLERVISVRAVTHAVLRYSESTGVLRMARVRKRHQAEVAELFASVLLDRPGFFGGAEARDLYTLEPAERAGADFAFDHRYDPQIERVRIVEAAADVLMPGPNGDPCTTRSVWSRDEAGRALAHLHVAAGALGGSWRLGELTFRVDLRSQGGRPPQVTVRLRPPALVQFRRTQNEARVMTLLERNGLMQDRDDYAVAEAIA